MEPLWVAQPEELYYLLRVEDEWALAAWEGNSPTWSVWMKLDTRVQQMTIMRPPPTVTGELWLIVFAPTQTYGPDDEPLRVAQAGEWYRVASQESGWVLAVVENDDPSVAVWFPLSGAVGMTTVELPGPSGRL
jgi:hypothetical protein